MATAIEVKPEDRRPDWRMSIRGIGIYTDVRLPEGVVQFYSSDGKLLGTIHNVGSLHLSDR